MLISIISDSKRVIGWTSNQGTKNTSSQPTDRGINTEKSLVEEHIRTSPFWHKLHSFFLFINAFFKKTIVSCYTHHIFVSQLASIQIQVQFGDFEDAKYKFIE